jgi:hypothetical protein
MPFVPQTLHLRPSLQDCLLFGHRSRLLTAERCTDEVDDHCGTFLLLQPGIDSLLLSGPDLEGGFGKSGVVFVVS